MDAQVQGLTKGLDPAKGAHDSKSAEIDNELLRELIERANTQYRSRSISLNFAVDKDAARTVITVVDQQTEKVIRQIPPDEILALIRNMKRMQMQLIDTEA